MIDKILKDADAPVQLIVAVFDMVVAMLAGDTKLARRKADEAMVLAEYRAERMAIALAAKKKTRKKKG